eukprot:1189467-Prorocentrum_minimum.AAC.1
MLIEFDLTSQPWRLITCSRHQRGGPPSVWCDDHNGDVYRGERQQMRGRLRDGVSPHRRPRGAHGRLLRCASPPPASLKALGMQEGVNAWVQGFHLMGCITYLTALGRRYEF